MNPVSLAILVGISFLVVLWVRSQPAHKRGKVVLLTLLTCVAFFTLLMALTGRLHWLAAVAAGLLPFARNLLPILMRILPFASSYYRQKKQTQQSQGNHSEVNTRIIKMRLDHDSGVMYGRVSEGPYAGKELGNLSEQEFIDLLNYCRQHDSDSARLLEAYLDKRFGDSWRQDDPQQNHSQGDHGKATSSNNGLSVQDAYDILGLSPGCSKQEIIAAHRRMMQKNHPDRGGSDYLAAKINQAKELLLAAL